MFKEKVARPLHDNILEAIRTDESLVLELLSLFDLHAAGRITNEKYLTALESLREEAETAYFMRLKSDRGADAGDYATKESKEGKAS